MVVEVSGLSALAHDQESIIPAEVAFPEPVLSAPELSASFVQLYAALETPVTRLERDERLLEWLRMLIERFATAQTARSTHTQRDDRALRRACDYLRDRPELNIGLDELATAAGIGKFRLVRLFRERTGLPPHALQIAHRVRTARRLREAGETPVAVAAMTGFADQSHLHRHFQRGLGVTPGEYQRRVTA